MIVVCYSRHRRTALTSPVIAQPIIARVYRFFCIALKRFSLVSVVTLIEIYDYTFAQIHIRFYYKKIF